MRKIAVFTATRAEYSLLYWLMKAIHADDDLQLQLIVSGSHLSPEYGQTSQEIESDGFLIDARVEMLLSSDSTVGIVKSMGLGLIGFSDALARLQPDILVILGDRYEALAIAQAALIMTIPIAHIHGGEITWGAYDDAIRHAITKMANVHFSATETYRRRIIQLGEHPDTVFNAGAPGLEQMMKAPTYSFDALRTAFNLALKQPYFLVTFHPETLTENNGEEGLTALLNVLEQMPEYDVLMTYPNADNGGYRLIQMMQKFQIAHAKRVYFVKSLGRQYYRSALSHAHGVIGNSSSGIIEAPLFGIPTVNIGLREKGRLAAASVIHAHANFSSIQDAVIKALNPVFREMCRTVTNPYGDGHVSEKIVSVLKQCRLSTLKHFQDIGLSYA